MLTIVLLDYTMTRGVLMVCDFISPTIHRYRPDGQTLDVITPPDNVLAMWVTRHGDGDQCVASGITNRLL